MADASTNPSVKIWGVDELSAFERIMQCYTNKIECCIPAQILDYDRQSHIATVRPLTNIVYESGNAQVRAKLRVTVLRMCSGGYIIDLPIKKGDTGWIIAADHDSSLVKQANASVNPENNKGAQNPNVFSHHKFSHGFFVCDNWAKISDEKFRDKLVIGDIDEDGTDTYFTIDKEGHMIIHADKSITLTAEDANIESNVKIFGTFDCQKDSHFALDISIDGNAAIGGKLTVNRETLLKSQLKVEGASEFNSSIQVVGKPANIILNPSADLKNTDARMREVVIVTGVKGKDTDNKVHLRAVKARVLMDIPEEDKDPTFTAGEGSLVLADDISIRYVTLDGEDKLEIKHFNDNTADHSIPYSQLTSGTEGSSYHTYYMLVREVVGNTKTMRFVRIPFIDNIPCAWSYSANTHKLHNCWVTVGRRSIAASNLSSGYFQVADNFSGTIYAHVYHPVGSNDITVTVETSSSTDDDENTWIPIHSFYNGLINGSYLGAPVLPLYE